MNGIINQENKKNYYLFAYSIKNLTKYFFLKIELANCLSSTKEIDVILFLEFKFDVYSNVLDYVSNSCFNVDVDNAEYRV